MLRNLYFVVVLFFCGCGPDARIKGPYRWQKINLSGGVSPEKVAMSRDGGHIYAVANGGLFYQAAADAKIGEPLKRLPVALPAVEWLSPTWSGLSLGYGKVLMLFDAAKKVWSFDATSAYKKIPGFKNNNFIFSKVVLINDQWTLAFGQGEPGLMWLKDIDKPEKDPTPFRLKITEVFKGENFAIILADNAQDGDLILAVQLIGRIFSFSNRQTNLFLVPIPQSNTIPYSKNYGAAATAFIAMMAEHGRAWSFENYNIQCIGSMLHKGEQCYYAGMGPQGNAKMGLAFVHGSQLSLDRKKRLFSMKKEANLSFPHESILGVEIYRDYNLAVTAEHGLLGLNSDGTRAPKDDFNLKALKAPLEIIGFDDKVRSIHSDSPEDTFLIMVEGHGAYLRFR